MRHRYNMPMKFVLMEYLRAGVRSNRQEYAYWKRSHDPRVMPVKCSLLFGIVNIQSSGDRVSQEDIRRESPLARLDQAAGQVCDSLRAEQFARNRDGAILLVDYGHMDAEVILVRTIPTPRLSGAVTSSV